MSFLLPSFILLAVTRVKQDTLYLLFVHQRRNGPENATADVLPLSQQSLFPRSYIQGFSSIL